MKNTNSGTSTLKRNFFTDHLRAKEMHDSMMSNAPNKDANVVALVLFAIMARSSVLCDVLMSLYYDVKKDKRLFRHTTKKFGKQLYKEVQAYNIKVGNRFEGDDVEIFDDTVERVRMAFGNSLKRVREAVAEIYRSHGGKSSLSINLLSASYMLNVVASLNNRELARYRTIFPNIKCFDLAVSERVVFLAREFSESVAYQDLKPGTTFDATDKLRAALRAFIDTLTNAELFYVACYK